MLAVNVLIKTKKAYTTQYKAVSHENLNNSTVQNSRKVGLHEASRQARQEIFRKKAYFDFRFRVVQFPFNPVYLTSVSASKSQDINIFPFKKNFV
jgi:hypothetical protein